MISVCDIDVLIPTEDEKILTKNDIGACERKNKIVGIAMIEYLYISNLFRLKKIFIEKSSEQSI